MYLDNPLICSCELTWFPKLLLELKNRDDEMAQKKKPVCHMPVENREYYVQAMPLEKMHCVGLQTNGATNFATFKIWTQHYFSLASDQSLLSLVSFSIRFLILLLNIF